jgi:hypothetical protein
MAKQPSLLDDVVATASSVFQGTIPWYRRIAAEHKQEVAGLKAAWKSGKIAFPLRTYARAISKHLRDRGIATIGEQGVQHWLKND